MSQAEQLLKADADRRAAIVAGNSAAVAAFLAEDLTWTHSSGKTDSKDSFLAVISAGDVVYHSLDTRDTQVRQMGELFILEGVVFGDVTKDGQDRTMKNRFLSVWRESDGQFRMHAWQSTGLS